MLLIMNFIASSITFIRWEFQMSSFLMISLTYNCLFSFLCLLAVSSTSFLFFQPVSLNVSIDVCFPPASKNATFETSSSLFSLSCSISFSSSRTLSSKSSMYLFFQTLARLDHSLFEFRPPLSFESEESSLSFLSSFLVHFRRFENYGASYWDKGLIISFWFMKLWSSSLKPQYCGKAFLSIYSSSNNGQSS